ncbi:hypothetical protein [Nitrosomonas marina]|uniref:Uncharacterized protein n=1 Tax=Nitrosomonas marina TaxID=917 RepID=A0A1H8IIE6_9PROT|nr:hypothetical protein [Nitrosomonas marina]SEN68042.1 hypothetical protein SAMN05216325_1339 [Nitrosomonas marina]
MMDEAHCPYCGESQEINHDDGYGYEEDKLHRQGCGSCGKEFVFTTSIHFYYATHVADCLNGSEHKYEPTNTYPVEYTKMKCRDCGEIRNPTEVEMALIMEARDKP